MRTARKTLAVTCAAMTLLTMAGCGTSENASGDTTVTFQTWNLKNDTYTPYFNDLMKQFEKDNPGVKVKWVDQPAENYDQKLSTDAAACIPLQNATTLSGLPKVTACIISCLDSVLSGTTANPNFS